MWTSMGTQFIKHIIQGDLDTSDWKHLLPMQSNTRKFEDILRFILLTGSLFRRCAGRQNLKAVVWVPLALFEESPKSLQVGWFLRQQVKFKREQKVPTSTPKRTWASV